MTPITENTSMIITSNSTMLAMSVEERNSVYRKTFTDWKTAKEPRVLGQNSITPHGNNNLNFRLARDQVERLETVAISLAAGDKQIMFSQFVLFLMRNGKFFFPEPSMLSVTDGPKITGSLGASH